jgi:hypothetical protein
MLASMTPLLAPDHPLYRALDAAIEAGLPATVLLILAIAIDEWAAATGHHH